MSKRRTRDRTEHRPAKIKGSIPAPRVSPARTFVPVHRRRSVQILATVIVLAAIAFAVWRVLETRSEKSEAHREIEIFQRSAEALLAPAAGALDGMNSAPEQFLAGGLDQEEFRTEAETWVEVFREIHAGLREQDVPDTLEEVRALFVQGAVVYLDGAKAYLLAADIDAQEQREEAVQLGRNLITHATAVFGMGQRALEELRLDLGLSEPGPNELLDQPFNLPEEDIPAPPPDFQDAITGTPSPLFEEDGG